jgi:hypothetical protein
MKIRPVGSELFHVDRLKDKETDRQTWRSQQSLFAILQTRLKTVLSSYVEISDTARDDFFKFVLYVDYLPSNVCCFEYLCDRLSNLVCKIS